MNYNGVISASDAIEVKRGIAPNLAIAFVQELGRKFKAVGEDVVRKLMASSLVSPATMSAMAEFTPDVLKTLGLAA